MGEDRPSRASAPPAVLRSQRSGKLGHASGDGEPFRQRFRQSGFSIVELTIALVLLITIAVFGLQTIVSSWTLQNWSIAQSMTDAYASIETANAQRWVFNAIPSSGRWPVLPAFTSTQITLGVSPHGPVTGTVIRTSQPPVVDAATGATSYLLESYVIYKSGLRQYCKVSKVYRDQ